MKLYRIANWNEHFENARTRPLRSLLWVPFPNKHDGDGYTELLEHKDGPAHYGCWVATVQVASKCEPRGTLIREGGKPHDARSISRITRIPAKVLQEAWDRLVETGWMEVAAAKDLASPCNALQESVAPIDATQGCDASQKSIYGMEGNGMEGNGTESEGKGTELSCSEPAASEQQASEWIFPVVGDEKQKTWTLPTSKVAEFVEAYPGIDVDLELRRARQWCRDNRERRKTATGMPKFLNAWMSKAQNTAAAGRSPPAHIADPRGTVSAIQRYMEGSQ